MTENLIIAASVIAMALALGVVNKLMQLRADKFVQSLEDRMIECGWETNGTYWWFEDSGQMTFQDAVRYFRGSQ